MNTSVLQNGVIVDNQADGVHIKREDVTFFSAQLREKDTQITFGADTANGEWHVQVSSVEFPAGQEVARGKLEVV